MLLLSGNAMAETVIVVNSDGSTQQIVRSEPVYYTTTYTPATVVREPVQTSYYYDTNPGLNFVAGLTTAIVGGIVFDSITHHHHKHVSAPAHHKPGHGIKVGSGHHASAKPVKPAPGKPVKGGHKKG